MHTYVFFCGIKHSGKSTLGRLVAQELGLPWFDLDDLVLENLVGYPSIRTFYQEKGQKAFQSEEVKALQSLYESHPDRCIISLGGGASDNDELLALAKQRGSVVYLAVEPEVLLERILRGGIPPFLDPKDPQHSFLALYAKRDERYRNICDFLVRLPNYPDVRDTARFLVDKLKSEV
ncbi:MAG: shikimate kinase [Sphaerochaeta sp.]|uniref:shikimate kinase n=1 Tax=Sphaerochaeta sp. TaxID=1972642 RepID=UPI002FC6694C